MFLLEDGTSQINNGGAFNDFSGYGIFCGKESFHLTVDLTKSKVMR